MIDAAVRSAGRDGRGGLSLNPGHCKEVQLGRRGDLHPPSTLGMTAAPFSPSRLLCAVPPRSTVPPRHRSNRSGCFGSRCHHSGSPGQCVRRRRIHSPSAVSPCRWRQAPYRRGTCRWRRIHTLSAPSPCCQPGKRSSQGAPHWRRTASVLKIVPLRPGHSAGTGTQIGLLPGLECFPAAAEQQNRKCSLPTSSPSLKSPPGNAAPRRTRAACPPSSQRPPGAGTGPFAERFLGTSRRRPFILPTYTRIPRRW